MEIVGVLNRTRGANLAANAEVARSWSERGRGLLGRSALAPGSGLLILPCNSIHSFFMRFTFDALFLDRNYHVLHVLHSMPPWRLSRIVWRAHAVLELPAGVAATTGTQTGDELTLLV
ncbi:MAG: DUF192 domain-containing protein [Chloroflexi bacterium]|nr:DUF192 domain-containing protein [Chloroflexota bacterium]